MARKVPPKAVQNWKCTTMPADKRKNRIFVRGLDENLKIVFERAFGYKGWARNLHPVVMQNEFRRDHSIVMIVMKRYDKYGDLLHDIMHEYSADTGEYVFGQNLHPNNAYSEF